MNNAMRTLLILVAVLFLLTWSVAAQEAQAAPEPSPQAEVAAPPAPSSQPQRPGSPRAFGDKDGDGICDITGQPVGKRAQGGPGAGQGRGQRLRQDAPAGAGAGSGPSYRKQGRRGGCKGVCDRAGRGFRGRGPRS